METSALLPVLLFASLSVSASAAAAERVVLPGGVVPLHYALSLTPDAAHSRFTGSVQIELDVQRATRVITLNAAELQFTQVALSGSSETPTTTFDSTHETATLTFKSAITPGHHVLTIDYAGKINEHPAGLFALDYDTPDGKKRALFTQFENSDARRVFPCWDEPAIKATFTLTVTVPADQLAVSNMPVASHLSRDGKLAQVSFAPTPKMSTYLLFFGLGDFERISRTVNGVDIGVIVQRGEGPKGKYALDAAAELLPYYEDYFGVKYPLPKLDLIGGPGQSQFFGAMENWGAIFSFERDLIVDPKLSTESDQRRVYVVAAHEIAHMWFGDLVTMNWWDDLWLNEGFASWMEYKAPAHFHPQWQPWLDALAAKEEAMRLDARDGTHPVITPIQDVLQANQAFDTITYSKGQAVVRMLEDYMGERAFRDGVRAYIKTYAYGNTVTDDLWRELDKSSGQDITQVAHSFTQQAGIPLVRAECTETGMRLQQQRFTADGSGKPAARWNVPVTVAEAGGKELWRGVVSADKPVDVPVPAGVVPLVNAGQGGYFRTLYDSGSLARLASRFASLAPLDQLGLLNDSQALGFAGYEPLTDFMELTRRLSAATDPVVLDHAVNQVDRLNFLYEGLPGQPAFKAYARSVLAPVLAQIGWDAKPGEDANITLLRNSLLATLGRLDDPEVMRQARLRFAVYLKSPDSFSPDLRRAVLRIVADHADAATWEQLHQLAKAAVSNLEKRELYARLASAHDRTLAERALALSLTDEVPATSRPSVLVAVSSYFPELALDFFIQHAKTYEAFLEPGSRSRFAPQLASSGRDLAILKTLHAYADKNIPESARGDVVRTDAEVTENARIRAQRLPEVDAWLKTHR